MARTKQQSSKKAIQGGKGARATAKKAGKKVKSQQPTDKQAETDAHASLISTSSSVDDDANDDDDAGLVAGEAMISLQNNAQQHSADTSMLPAHTSNSYSNYGAIGVSRRDSTYDSVDQERKQNTGETVLHSPSPSEYQHQHQHQHQQQQRINSYGGSDSASSSITAAEAMLVPKFIQAQVSDDELRGILRCKGESVAAFYEAQNDLISRFLDVNQNNTDSAIELQNEQRRQKQRQVDRAVYISVVVNVFVVLAQLYAAISSRSLALFATMSEASMDLLSSVILLLASMAARRHDRFSLYPTGRFKLETIGVIIFAVLMGTFSVALLIESVSALLNTEHTANRLSIYDAVCVIAALLAKIALYLYCYTLREYHTAHVLMTDHKNDVIVNAFGLTMAIVGKHMMAWMDPLGSLIIALMILRSWVEEAWEQIKLIVGIRADPQLLQLLTYTAITHDSRIQKIDRVVAYHSGANLFVEVDIVMAPETTLVTLHDVAESLQEKYERMPGVGRCHVHVDYEVTHRSEHRNAVA
ncbi:hypothetical protein GGI25_005787 [Coemansia spiralis]|uniref:Cation efflux protein transmembrane domain-containing protein n=2 Tax=Coemansia TaxID=4863 RepID=A0A9W8G3H6_9FUNG|nr:hypothetical protein EDC05_005872 [Coemansia umbellata]KAJ2619283.1 hypothetical protein GGI26_005962 [Coemansia sp. RSA 1358]KAJ2670618.1 hypothetical protein GGI25_005787 [Coemansia spiralis]